MWALYPLYTFRSQRSNEPSKFFPGGGAIPNWATYHWEKPSPTFQRTCHQTLTYQSQSSSSSIFSAKFITTHQIQEEADWNSLSNKMQHHRNFSSRNNSFDGGKRMCSQQNVSFHVIATIQQFKKNAEYKDVLKAWQSRGLPKVCHFNNQSAG